MIVSSEAIVLQSMKYGETSRIVTLFTKEFGKLRIIAKGARGNKPRFGAALEPMSHSHIVFYNKQSRDLQFLSQAELLRQFKSIIDTEEKLMIGFAMIEYLNVVIQGEEEHLALFELLESSLAVLESTGRNHKNPLLRFLIRLSSLLGFSINMRDCLACRAHLHDTDVITGSVRFETQQGGFYCTKCARMHPGKEVSGDAFRSMQWITKVPIAEVCGVALSRRASQDVSRILHHHIASHIHGMRTIKSLALMDVFS